MSRLDKELRDRWTAESAEFAFNALIDGRPESPFGTHEGRVDARGLLVEQPSHSRQSENLIRIAKTFKFDRKKIGDVDLSHAVLPEWRVYETVFENCIFDHSKMSSFRAYSARFVGCGFRFSALKDAVLGAASTDRNSGGDFEDCDFSGADLRGVRTDPGRFVRCNFQETKWKGTRFLSTVLEYCDFRKATVESCFFDGRKFVNNAPAGVGQNRLIGCDFSTTALDDTSFLAIDFRNCVPPAGDDFVLIDHYPRMVEDALSYLKGSQGKDASIAAAVLGVEVQSSKFLPHDAVGLLQLSHYPGGSRVLVANAFGIGKA